ncbi:endocuticle structural glycoprotein SgAbd-8-like [Hetaerina americana]|uniref:endocuticle structural glycoprotein SgAbd-8-like n=1 Tax=Hetaerina americana TaxID=62018 RepID=UPI003A7F125D
MRTLAAISLLLTVALASPQYRPGALPAGAPIPIIRQTNTHNPGGGYAWSYETGNGITAEESGQLKNPGQKDLEAMVAQGGFAYTSPEGIPIQVRYVADENGFRAEGAHLPVPPPIPPAIQRALDYLATLPSTTERPYRNPGRPF